MAVAVVIVVICKPSFTTALHVTKHIGDSNHLRLPIDRLPIDFHSIEKATTQYKQYKRMKSGVALL